MKYHLPCDPLITGQACRRPFFSLPFPSSCRFQQCCSSLLQLQPVTGSASLPAFESGGGRGAKAKLCWEVISPLKWSNARAVGSESMVRVMHPQMCLCVVRGSREISPLFYWVFGPDGASASAQTLWNLGTTSADSFSFPPLLFFPLYNHHPAKQANTCQRERRRLNFDRKQLQTLKELQ